MCVYSMVMDHYIDRVKPLMPTYPDIGTYPPLSPPVITPPISPADVEKFREMMKDMEELLKRAKKYDEDNKEPECESETKKKILSDLAAQLGVEINFAE